MLFLRFFLQDDEEQFRKTKLFIQRLELVKEESLITDIVFAEVVWVLNKVYDVPRPEIADVILQRCQILLAQDTSTLRIAQPKAFNLNTNERGFFIDYSGSLGRMMVNSVPLSTVLVTEISPLCALIIQWVIASPRPVPPSLLDCSLSTR